MLSSISQLCDYRWNLVPVSRHQPDLDRKKQLLLLDRLLQNINRSEIRGFEHEEAALAGCQQNEASPVVPFSPAGRSGERRVGEGGRSRGGPCPLKKKECDGVG